MFKAVAVKNTDKKSRKKLPVWKRITFWYKDYYSKHNRSKNDSVTHNAVDEISHDIDSRIATQNPEIFTRHLLR